MEKESIQIIVRGVAGVCLTAIGFMGICYKIEYSGWVLFCGLYAASNI